MIRRSWANAKYNENRAEDIKIAYVGGGSGAGDCPMDAVTNRIRTVNLRLTSGMAAVHSDMLMWDYEERAEIADEQFINILFSVPQISMRIEEFSKEQYVMLQFYLKLWEEHREIITKEIFVPFTRKQIIHWYLLNGKIIWLRRHMGISWCI